MTQFDACLYDLDGTLIDSVDLILDSYRHTLTRHHGTAPDDAVWLAGLGTPLRAQLQPFARDANELEQMVATYRDFNFTHHDTMIRPFPGTRSTLEYLKELGVKLGIVTSKLQHGLRRGLRVCGLEDLFAVLVAADDVTKHKPDPAPVFKALDLLQVRSDRTLFVGDSPHDMAAGRAAGVSTAAALWGPFKRGQLALHSPDHWLSRPNEVTSLIG
jgi:pyrophosphatase PpaX